MNKRQFKKKWKSGYKVRVPKGIYLLLTRLNVTLEEYAQYCDDFSVESVLGFIGSHFNCHIESIESDEEAFEYDPNLGCTIEIHYDKPIPTYHIIQGINDAQDTKYESQVLN